ncbi:hypothetical protein HZA97_04330 [Candidatus Woesearchaeota archaeon]|nr:hypothetical protein [Candidatus Woesearchaeota archaeon]
MTIELINPYVLKILISAREVDSINSISDRIDLSYGWTHKWVRELASKGVFRLTRMNVYLNKNNEFYKKTLEYIKKILLKEVQFYYEVLSLFGVEYSFTKTDAVFVWTKGGYNIGRYNQFYPIFIKVRNSDKNLFEWYCKKLSLKSNKAKGIFYKIEYLDSFKVDYCEDIPVDSLSDTIAFAEKFVYNFEPALEMIKESYDKKIKVKYKEVITNA